MERRDFLGAALALFTWTVLPEREIEMIHLFSSPEPDYIPSVEICTDAMMKRMMSEFMNLQLYAPRGQVTVTHVGEPGPREYAQWWVEQQGEFQL